MAKKNRISKIKEYLNELRSGIKEGQIRIEEVMPPEKEGFNGKKEFYSDEEGIEIGEEANADIMMTTGAIGARYYLCPDGKIYQQKFEQRLDDEYLFERVAITDKQFLKAVESHSSNQNASTFNWLNPTDVCKTLERLVESLSDTNRKATEAKQLHIVKLYDGTKYVEIHRGIYKWTAKKVARQRDYRMCFLLLSYSIDPEDDMVRIERVIYDDGYPFLSGIHSHECKFSIEDLRTLVELLDSKSAVIEETRTPSEINCNVGFDSQKFHEILADQNYKEGLESKQKDSITAIRKFSNAYGYYRSLEDLEKAELCRAQLKSFGLSDEEIGCYTDRGMADSLFFGDIADRLFDNG